MNSDNVLLSLSGLPDFLASLKPEPGKTFILLDKHTRKHCLPILLEAAPGLNSAIELLNGLGESSKSMNQVIRLSHAMLRNKAERGSLLINLGGGVISDLGGFTASILKRGIRYINIPSTLLAMVDAAHGGKTGVNSGHLKNQLGSFHFPLAVVIHPSFLDTLPQKHIRSGFAEMLKHGLIADAAHFSHLISLQAGDISSHPELILQSASIKNRIVNADPHDRGLRNLLNFGHTAGHAIESLFMERRGTILSHGHAVAIGMMVESLISAETAGLSPEELHAILHTLRSSYEVPKIGQQDIGRLMKLLGSDKKIESGVLMIPLLSRIGEARQGYKVSHSSMEKALRTIFDL